MSSSVDIRLIDRLRDEAALCRNETAEEVADLLDEATDTINSLTDALAARDWRSIETAPKTNLAILVHCSTIKCTFGVTWDSADGCWIHFGGSGQLTEDAPSYWMPMPPDPKKEAKQ